MPNLEDVSLDINDQTVEELLVPVLDQLARTDLEIPMLPQVANQVLLLANDPEANASQFAILVEQDQVLACRVLKLANSPASGARYPIDSLHQAISWLGLNFLCSTAFSFSVQSGVFMVEGYEQEVKKLWAHTLAVGLYCKAIAKRMGYDPDNAFLCGLLHAIGKPYVTHTVNLYQQNLETRYPWKVLDRVIDESYIEAGRQLAIGWGLPEPVKDAILFHEDLAFAKSISPTKAASITCLARHLTAELFRSVAGNEETLLALPVTGYLQAKREDVLAWLAIQDSIRESVTPMLA